VSDADVKEMPFLKDPDTRRADDLVHIWGLEWIIVLKVVVKVVCYVIIVCFFVEVEEIIEEPKQVWVCKWVRPKDFEPKAFDPSNLG
jgi:hypothetical protein